MNILLKKNKKNNNTQLKETCDVMCGECTCFFSFSYEWIVPIQWMKNDAQQNIFWLESKTGEQQHAASYSEKGCG